MRDHKVDGNQKVDGVKEKVRSHKVRVQSKKSQLGSTSHEVGKHKLIREGRNQNRTFPSLEGDGAVE